SGLFAPRPGTESFGVSKAPSRESKKDGLKIRLLTGDMMVGMSVLGQPAQNAGRAARKVVNPNPKRTLLQPRRLHLRHRQHLFRVETVRLVKVDGNYVGDRQQVVQSRQRIVGDDLSMVDDHDAVAEPLRLF